MKKNSWRQLVSCWKYWSEVMIAWLARNHKMSDSSFTLIKQTLDSFSDWLEHSRRNKHSQRKAFSFEDHHWLDKVTSTFVHLISRHTIIFLGMLTSKLMECQVSKKKRSLREPTLAPLGQEVTLRSPRPPKSTFCYFKKLSEPKSDSTLFS